MRVHIRLRFLLLVAEGLFITAGLGRKDHQIGAHVRRIVIVHVAPVRILIGPLLRILCMGNVRDGVLPGGSGGPLGEVEGVAVLLRGVAVLDQHPPRHDPLSVLVLHHAACFRLVLRS